jgi:uncharacterized protein YbjT (DUF2867 family)
MNRVLVIGGTGNVGRQVVHQLTATGARFRVTTRNPDSAGLPPQVEVVRGDLTVPESLKPPPVLLLGRAGGGGRSARP